MAAVNCASFSMVSSAAPLWTLVKTDVLKKYLQFWWSIWYSSSNNSALTSGEDRYQRQKKKCYQGYLVNAEKQIHQQIHIVCFDQLRITTIFRGWQANQANKIKLQYEYLWNWPLPQLGKPAPCTGTGCWVGRAWKLDRALAPPPVGSSGTSVPLYTPHCLLAKYWRSAVPWRLEEY